MKCGLICLLPWSFTLPEEQVKLSFRDPPLAITIIYGSKPDLVERSFVGKKMCDSITWTIAAKQTFIKLNWGLHFSSNVEWAGGNNDALKITYHWLRIQMAPSTLFVLSYATVTVLWGSWGSEGGSDWPTVTQLSLSRVWTAKRYALTIPPK